MRRALFGLLVLLLCNGMDCLSGSSYSPEISFAMYEGSPDDTAFNLAWQAAQADPEAGVDYTFPLITRNVEAGAVVRLYAGRPTGLLTADDVIVEEQHLLATTTVADDGTAAFAPLTVATGAWQSDRGEIPAALLCGPTLIVARAYEPGRLEGRVGQFLAATWFYAVTEPCPE